MKFVALILLLCNQLANSQFCGTSSQQPWIGLLCDGHSTKNCFCGVNLITKLHAITAAHCLHREEASWPQFRIHFGRLDLDRRMQQSRRIFDVAIHPDWKHRKVAHEADIAVLRMKESVSFNENVQPVCLPLPQSQQLKLNDGLIVSSLKLSKCSR